MSDDKQVIDDGLVHTGGIYDPATWEDDAPRKRFGWDDVTVLITNAILEQVNPGTPEEYASFHLTGIPEGDSEERTKFFSAGNNKVSEDGERLVPGADGKLTIGKNEFGRFIKALAGSGIPRETMQQFEAKVSTLNGKRIHFSEQEVTDKEGKPKMRTAKDGRVWPQTKPFPAKGGWRSAAGGKTGSNGSVDDAIVAKAIETATKAAVDKGGKATYTEVSKYAMESLSTDPDRLKVAGLLADRKFFKVSGRPWQTDGTAITI